MLDLRATLTARGVPVALVTDAVNVGEGALAPGASRTFTWVRPEAPTGPVEVRAVLRAAAVRADTLEALGLEARRAEVVTHEVATATLRLGP
ncbi:MAG: hypothetical protein INH41_19775 [Myxococcaceae bacterium]|nr:hypothetical protein [Myxococcaceae bacterium]